MATEKLLMVIAAIFIIVSIASALITDDSWRSVGIVWGLLCIGIIFFALSL